MNKNIFTKLFFLGFFSFACLPLTAMERYVVIDKFDAEDFKSKFKKTLESKDCLSEIQQLILLLPIPTNSKAWQHLIPAIHESPITADILKSKVSLPQLEVLRNQLYTVCNVLYELKRHVVRVDKDGSESAKAQLFRPQYLKAMASVYVCVFLLIIGKLLLPQRDGIDFCMDYYWILEFMICSLYLAKFTWDANLPGYPGLHTYSQKYDQIYDTLDAAARELKKIFNEIEVYLHSER